MEAEAGVAPAPEAVRQAMGLSQSQWQRLDKAPASLRLVPLEDAAEPMAWDPADDGPEDPRGAQALALVDQLPPLQARAIRSSSSFLARA
jgi:hypothetical protein